MIIIFSLGDFAGVVIQNKPFQVYREQYHEGGGLFILGSIIEWCKKQNKTKKTQQNKHWKT